jgi:hypothetical protein
MESPKLLLHDSDPLYISPHSQEISHPPPGFNSELPLNPTLPNTTGISTVTSSSPSLGPNPQLLSDLSPMWPSAEPPPGLQPLPPPPTGSRAHSCPLCRKVFKIQKQLSRRRTELLTFRAHFQNEQNGLAQLREFDVTSRKAVVEALSLNVDRGTLADDLEMIKALHQKSLVAYHDLTKAENELNRLRNRLSNLEYKYGKREEEINCLIFHRLAKDETSHNGGSESMLDDLDSGNQTESEQMPSLLVEYYDKAGDVGIEWDRLQELDAEHHKHTIEREQDFAEGGSLVPTEHDFRDQYLADRTGIVRRLLQAKDDARGLRLQCQELGYSIQDDESNRDMDENDLLIGTTALDWSRNVNSIKTPGHDRLLQMFLLGEANNEQRMDDWLKGNAITQTTTSTTRHTPLRESRQAYSEIGLETRSGIGPEPSLKQETLVLEAETEEHTTEYRQTRPELAHVESTLSGISTSLISTWQPEVSLQRRYSTPELRQLVRHA